jgi:hypothetical protein
MSNATEGDILGNASDIIKDLGVVDLAGGHLLVTEDSPKGMTVQVAGGVVYVPNSNYDELDSDTPKFYPVVCSSEVLTVDNNVSGSTRYDIVCVKVDKTIVPDADADNIATKVVVKGTPGAGIPATPANHYKLAEVEVVNGETEIENSMITDTREQVTVDERFVSFTGLELTESTKTDINGIVGGDGANLVEKTLGDSLKDTANVLDVDTDYLGTEIYDMQRQSIINGNFDVWQRGTSRDDTTAQSHVFLADRWSWINSADGGSLPGHIVHSRQALTSGDLFKAFYFYRIAPNGTGSSLGNSSYAILRQRIEFGTRYLCGNSKKVTVSFWARSSIAGKRIGISLQQNYGTGGSPSSAETIAGQIITLTSTLTKYTITFTTNTLSGKTFGTDNNDYLALQMFVSWGTTIATSNFGGGTAEGYGNGNIDIAQVQVNSGDIALPYLLRNYQKEESDCLRYYEKSDINPIFSGTVTSGITYYMNIFYKARKRIRVSPTITNISGNLFPNSASSPLDYFTGGYIASRQANSTGANGFFWESYEVNAEL